MAVKGLKALRHEIAEWLNRSEKLSFTWEDILIGPGSKELLFLVGLSLDCDLLIGTPCWVSYIPQTKFLGKSITTIETKFENRWRVTPEELDEACRRDEKDPNRKNKCMILTYPDNPTGLTYKPE